MGNILRINIGCHIWHLDGFVNIDLDENLSPKPDLVADGNSLPYEDNSVDEIYAGHMLEHYTMLEKPLKEWYRVLKPGGTITITVPDVEKGIAAMRAGTIDEAWLHQIVFGNVDTAGGHHRIYTHDILLKEVSSIFKDAKIINDSPYLVAKVDWQTIVTATK